VQQSPWLSISNKQLELMGRYMAAHGLTPASRSRVAAFAEAAKQGERVDRVEMVFVWKGDDGMTYEKPIDGSGPAIPHNAGQEPMSRHYLDSDL
jgi:hypothetical protein